MRKFYCTILILLSGIPVLPQNPGLIRGRVLDEQTGSPIHFADVYLSGTTIGTTTDEEGYFKIESIQAGAYQLVASMIGYNSLVRDIVVKPDTKMEVELSLKAKVYEVEPVTVSGERPADWDKCYAEFKKLFLGNTKFADYCTIQNPAVLSFNETDANTFTASADSAIIITNEYLGYKIICTLIEFSYDRKNQHLKYVILPRFYDLVLPGSPDRVTFANHRLSAYEGSIQHFMKGLIRNDFISMGYKVYKRAVVDYTETNYLKFNIDDSAALIKKNEAGNYDLSFKGYLKVLYGDKLSWLKLEYDEVTLNANGFSSIFTPFEVRGFWATEGISTLLPTDFEGS